MTNTCEVSRSVFNEHENLPNGCGLIAEVDIPTFLWTAPEEDQVLLFEHLCEASDGGYVSFRGRTVRLGHYLEGHNEVRSVVELLSRNPDDTENVRAVSLIVRPDGITCLESHTAVERQGQVISQPEIGSKDILTGTHQDLMLHYCIAYEAIPLQCAT